MKTMACERDVEEIRERLSGLTAADERQWGSMTVGTMVCHVREAFRMAAGERPAARVPQAIPPRLLKWLALTAPLRWPRGIKTVPELEEGQLQSQPGNFEADRMGLLSAIDGFLKKVENTTDHPYFGRMRTADWMRWAYLHTDHHLRQFGR